MNLTNKQYDLAKAITGTIALLTTFAGTVLGISSKNYNINGGE